ncbi:MAG: hypothetical protein MZV63_63405 [Marinilabiliales bacterium]|nr:hypothetical protein [Marinilabiliales bacterium]
MIVKAKYSVTEEGQAYTEYIILVVFRDASDFVDPERVCESRGQLLRHGEFSCAVAVPVIGDIS